MNIVKDFRNDLLKRRELEFVFESGANPGFEGALKTLIEKEKVDENNVVIKSVHGHFGVGEFKSEAFIYDSADDRLNIEPKKKEKKK